MPKKGLVQAFIEMEDGSAIRVVLPRHGATATGGTPRVERQVRALANLRRERDEARLSMRNMRAAIGRNA